MSRSRQFDLLASLASAIVVAILSGGCGSSADKGIEKNAPSVTSYLPPDLPPPAAYLPRPKGSLSFSKDIAPIVFQKCVGCHRPGEIGPFALSSYADVKKRASQIVEVIQKRIMPPWAPLPGYCRFERDRALSADQIGVISQWVSEGAPEGNPSELPPAPEFPNGWKYGKPDLVVTMPEPFVLAAESKDVFRKFVIRVPIETAKYVRAFDFEPGNRSAVHHMRLRVDPSSTSRSQDQLDPLPGFDGLMGFDEVEPDGFFLTWAPGYESVPKRADVAWTIQPGTDLVLELHLHGTGKTETVQSSIALYFQPNPPRQHQYLLKLQTQTIDIPPGKNDYFCEDRFTLPVDVSILSAMPHAHFLGKEIRAYAVLPDGEYVWLMRIADWDFNWQRDYTYAEPIALPRGTTLCMHITFDNSADNPRNPHDPPQRVMIGRETYDEMAQLIFQALVPGDADGRTLMAEVANKEFRDNMTKEQFLIEHGRATTETHYNLGCCYKQIGDLQNALWHFQESIRIKPDNVFSINNLGSVYASLARPKDAVEQYKRALEINPRDARVRNNLGIAYLDQGLLDEAASQFEEGIRITPEFAEAETNLGFIAMQRGNFDEAISRFERALKANPNFELAKDNLLRAKQQVSRKH